MNKDTQTPRHAVGTEVIIIANKAHHYFGIGERVKITMAHDILIDDNEAGYSGVNSKGEAWSFYESDCLPVTLHENTLLTEADNKLRYLEEGLQIIRKDFDALEEKIKAYIDDIKNAR